MALFWRSLKATIVTNGVHITFVYYLNSCVYVCGGVGVLWTDCVTRTMWLDFQHSTNVGWFFDPFVDAKLPNLEQYCKSPRDCESFYVIDGPSYVHGMITMLGVSFLMSGSVL